MKVQFSRKRPFTPEWRDNKKLPVNEQVTATLSPLELGDLITLIDSLQGATGGAIDPTSLTAGATKDVVKQFKEITSGVGHLLPKYVVINNLQDDSGPVDTAAVIKYPYYLDLVAELLSELASISMPNEAETKNLNPQLDLLSSPTQ